MKTYTIVVREINIDWRRLMTSSFEDFTKKAEAFLEEHITEYLSVDMALEDFARQYNQGLFDEITSPDSKQERAGNSLKGLSLSRGRSFEKSGIFRQKL
ncbi:MAG: hypothetical protein ACLS8J_06105 [Streptococcus salivarius]